MRSGYLDDIDHLIFGDRTVTIDIVHLEGPLELVLVGSVGRDAQGAHELAKVDGSAVVVVERSEDVFGELRCVA